MSESTTTDSDTSSCTGTNRIPEEALIEYLQTFAAELGRPPRARDMKREGRYADQTYYNRFENWDAALKKAGLYADFEPSKFDGAEHHFGALIDDMVRVATVVGRPPTEDEIDEHGEFGSGTYQSKFGSWPEALRTCGFPPRYRGGTMRPPDEQRAVYGKNWDEQRRKALSRDRYRCQHCGLTIGDTDSRPQDQLHVHHIVPIRWFDEPELGNHLLNLITLCPQCHRKWESSLVSDIDLDALQAEIRELAQDDRS
ncbi:HNH endonuclease [Halomicrobium sp. IBSBa]|nr:HNH endonuclease [Halomicrobium sp. IBSBa]